MYRITVHGPAGKLANVYGAGSLREAVATKLFWDIEPGYAAVLEFGAHLEIRHTAGKHCRMGGTHTGRCV